MCSETEDQLLKNIFDGYSPAARPVKDDKDAVKVFFGLSISQIVDVVSLFELFLFLDI